MQATLVTLILCVTLIQIVYSQSNDTEEDVLGNDRFFYFAYGSNLLLKRLHLRNPSAVFFRGAKLEHHRLDFYMVSDTWNGAVATIVEDEDEEVMGALWLLENKHMETLDEQEGVALGWYFAKNVTVTTSLGGRVLARTYEEVEEPTKLKKGELIPMDRLPSSTYLQVMLMGAIETLLPPSYIAYLISFPTNGKMATREMRDQLDYPF